MTTAAEPPTAVDLAGEPDFQLGGLLVSPSTCKVRAASGEDQRVEPRVMEVLVVLVRQAGRTVSRDQLIDACWGGRIVSDDAVARVVAQVRVLARSLEPAPFVLDTVPKVGFRLSLGEGGGEPTAAPAPAPVRRRWWRLAAALVVLIVAGGSAYWWFVLPYAGQLPGQNGRVEVMQFEPRQADPSLRRLASVVPESVVRLLTRVGVETAQHPLRRDDAIGGHAEFRVAGSVDRDGETYVVNGQILDRRSGLVLWSGRAESPVTAATGLPQRAARNVALPLQCALEDRNASHTPMEPAVFGLYLSACEALFDAFGASPEKMLMATRRLVKAAPRVAGAHAMHGIAAALVANGTDHSPEAMNALRAEARAAAEQALKLDPRTAKAHVALALSRGAGANWANRERDLQRALAIDPDLVMAVLLYADLLREVGRPNRAIEVGGPLSGDPRLGGLYVPLAFMLAARGDLQAAEAELARTGVGDDDHGAERWTIAAWWEDPRTGLAKVTALAQYASDPTTVACFKRFLSELPARKAAGTRGLPAECGRLGPDWRVRMLAREGDLDGAYAKIAQPRPTSRMATNFLFYPETKGLRADPRFMPLAKRLGLVDYWTQSGNWPDFCAEPDRPYDCKAVAAAL